MIETYRSFFLASVGASAAFIGLLFVALSFIDSEKVERAVYEQRRIVASNSFTQLVNIFFVSMVGLYANANNLGFVACVMAALSFLSTARLIPRSFKLQKRGRTLPYSLTVILYLAYVLEFVIGIKLLNISASANTMNYLALAIIVLYAGALARAWEITGIRKH